MKRPESGAVGMKPGRDIDYSHSRFGDGEEWRRALLFQSAT